MEWTQDELEVLPADLRAVIDLRYGVTTGNPMSFRAMAEFRGSSYYETHKQYHEADRILHRTRHKNRPLARRAN
jgi:hypothetical protein